MVRPSQERSTRALTDAQSTSIGTGTDVGDDGMDYDGGGTNPDAGPATPPVTQTVEVIADSSTWDKVLDFAESSIWDITLGANLTGIVFDNPPPAGIDAKMEVTYRQPSSGGPYTLDQPAAVDWQDSDGTAGGAGPTMPTAAESVLVVVYDVRDGGTSYGGTFDGGSTDEDFVAHGAMGTTETFDPADGHVHTGTLDDDCTATITAPAGDGPIQMEWWVTNDGVHDLTIIAAGGGSVTNDTTPDTTDGVTNRYILDRIPATTNDWVVDLVGASGSSSGHWELLVDPGSPPDPYYADGDFLYVEVS